MPLYSCGMCTANHYSALYPSLLARGQIWFCAATINSFTHSSVAQEEAPPENLLHMFYAIALENASRGLRSYRPRWLGVGSRGVSSTDGLSFRVRLGAVALSVIIMRVFHMMGVRWSSMRSRGVLPCNTSLIQRFLCLSEPGFVRCAIRHPLSQ